MAKFSKYLLKCIAAEGTDYTANDVSPGVGTKFGISASLANWLQKSITYTEKDIINLKQDDAELIIELFWNKCYGSTFSDQSVAEIVIDHLYNKGFERGSCHIQSLLIKKYKAQISADGIIGPKTVGAINAAVNKYGAASVYSAVREMRRKFYLGEKLSYCITGKCSKYCEGDSQYSRLVAIRLDRFFPANGEKVDDSTPEVDVLSNTDVNVEAAKVASKEAFNFKSPNFLKSVGIVVAALVVIFGGVWFLMRPKMSPYQNMYK